MSSNQKSLEYPEAAIVFLRTAQWLNYELAQQLEPYDLTAQQLKVLSIIAHSSEHRVTVNEIKAQMFDPMSNVSRLLNKLVSKKLIIKQRDKHDQRQVNIVLTPSGSDLLCQGKQAMDLGLAAMNKLLPAELKKLTQLMLKIRK